MSKIIAYLFNDEFVEVITTDEKLPQDCLIFLTENYDIVDRNGNQTLLEIWQVPICEKALKKIHEKKNKTISEEVTKLYKIIGELETQSQDANNQEYITFSDKVKEHTEQIDKLNLKMYQLNSHYEMQCKIIKNLYPEIINNQRERAVVINPEPQYYFQPVPNYSYPPIPQYSYPPVQQVIYPEPRMINNGPANSGYSGLIQRMGSRITDVKGWDKDAVETVQNWRILFKEYKYIYEWILERNHKISTNLNLISVVSSSLMGCFSAFKLWVQDDRTFQASSDIIMLFSNFLIAAITTSSKRYIDDNRNEKIRNYLEDVNKFLGTISSELIKSPEYRMEADEFIKSQQEFYSKLSTSKPNITISELTNAKKAYKEFENSFISYSANGTQTVIELNSIASGPSESNKNNF